MSYKRLGCFLVFCVVLSLCVCLSSSYVSCIQCCKCLWIVRSWLLLFFIYHTWIRLTCQQPFKVSSISMFYQHLYQSFLPKFIKRQKLQICVSIVLVNISWFTLSDDSPFAHSDLILNLYWQTGTRSSKSNGQDNELEYNFLMICR